jgi:ABC-type histidine transport system ATPase subunit
MNFAREVAHQVVYLDKGVLVEQGTPDEMFTNPKQESTRNFLQRVR